MLRREAPKHLRSNSGSAAWCAKRSIAVVHRRSFAPVRPPPSLRINCSVLLVRSHSVALTFVAGTAHDVLGPDLGRAVEDALRVRFSISDGESEEAYRSDEVDVRGWVALQNRIPQLAGIDAYQAVFVTAPLLASTKMTLSEARAV